MSSFSFEDQTDHSTWAQNELRRNLDNTMSKVIMDDVLINQGGPTNLNPIKGSRGFKIIFGLQVLIEYKVRFKANLDLGTGVRYGDFGATNSFHISAYNAGLGTSGRINNKNFVVDISAAINITLGSGNSVALPNYALGYNQRIPHENTFNNSVSFGQLFTWNSALNHNRFSVGDIQREGLIGFRIGNVNVSSNNDARFYLGDGGDSGWTGGIIFAMPIGEVGFQDFSGTYIENAKTEVEHEKLRNQITTIKNNKNLSEDQKKESLTRARLTLANFVKNSRHTQTPYQRGLNKASTFFRVNNNGYNATLDIIGDAWLQNGIHNAIKDLKFNYNHRNIEVWAGKSF